MGEAQAFVKNQRLQRPKEPEAEPCELEESVRAKLSFWNSMSLPSLVLELLGQWGVMDTVQGFA